MNFVLDALFGGLLDAFSALFSMIFQALLGISS
jgi:hypothetical protein